MAGHSHKSKQTHFALKVLGWHHNSATSHNFKIRQEMLGLTTLKCQIFRVRSILWAFVTICNPWVKTLIYYPRLKSPTVFYLLCIQQGFIWCKKVSWVMEKALFVNHFLFGWKKGPWAKFQRSLRGSAAAAIIVGRNGSEKSLQISKHFYAARKKGHRGIFHEKYSSSKRQQIFTCSKDSIKRTLPWHIHWLRQWGDSYLDP